MVQNRKVGQDPLNRSARKNFNKGLLQTEIFGSDVGKEDLGEK